VADRNVNELVQALAASKSGTLVLTQGETSLIDRFHRKSGEFAPPATDYRTRGLRGLFKGGR
jgi:hypothetical protein